MTILEIFAEYKEDKEEFIDYLKRKSEETWKN